MERFGQFYLMEEKQRAEIRSGLRLRLQLRRAPGWYQIAPIRGLAQVGVVLLGEPLELAPAGLR